MDDNQLLRISHVASAYYFKQAEAEPEPRHFNDWVNSLEEPMRTVFRRAGFEACKDMPNLRRFMAELKDEGLDEYMKRHLSPVDYSLWVQQGE